ncbi:MAG TPA: hypothetical protein VGQ36_16185 [Thermoanaerobaculia bacterium]|jgi:hypothetical protein|nr:hypothetical protein [Thermoanaerobaculia bacterium]
MSAIALVNQIPSSTARSGEFHLYRDDKEIVVHAGVSTSVLTTTDVSVGTAQPRTVYAIVNGITTAPPHDGLWIRHVGLPAHGADEADRFHLRFAAPASNRDVWMTARLCRVARDRVRRDEVISRRRSRTARPWQRTGSTAVNVSGMHDR